MFISDARNWLIQPSSGFCVNIVECNF